MARKLEGSYDFEEARRQRKLRPILAGAFEGDTEKNYINSLALRKWVSFKPSVFPGLHDKPLIDKALQQAEQFAAQARGVELIPIAVYDLEIVSDQRLSACVQALEYARAKKVQVYINAPTVERWFLQHFEPVSMNAPLGQIKSNLTTAIKRQGLPPYSKPGSPSFYEEIKASSRTAVTNCHAAGHLEHNGIRIPCMCRLIDLIDGLNP